MRRTRRTVTQVRTAAGFRGHGGWWWYTRVPGFAAASEWAYAFFARHRDLLSRATHLCSSRSAIRSSAGYFCVYSARSILRLFGAIYIAAFASLGVQVLGLVGHEGILPLGECLSAARQGWGAAAYWRLPTLFWVDSTDTVLLAATMIGLVLVRPVATLRGK